MTTLPPVRSLPVDSVPRVMYSRPEAALSMAIGIRSLDVLIAGREGNGFPVVHIGSRALIPCRELRDWVSRQVNSGCG